MANANNDLAWLVEDQLGPGPAHEPRAEAIPRRRTRRVLTQKERRIVAAEKHEKGHIVNPLGGPDTNPKRLDWRRARDIVPDGDVTVAQLWRHLFLKYEDAFGAGILENQLPDSRHAIQAWFDRICQRFLDTCGHSATYRDLAEYFSWMLQPDRLKRMIGIGSLTGSPVLKVQQIEGKVYIKRFYDEVLRRKSSATPPASPDARKTDEAIQRLREIFDEISPDDEGQTYLMYCMAKHGLVLVGQYLRERKGWSESRCRQHVVGALASFVMGAKDKSLAMAYARLAMTASEKNEYLYNEATMWGNWREWLPGALNEIAKESKNGQEKV